MSRNSKNASRIKKAKEISALHLKGEKGPATTGGSKKKNAWWQVGSGSYADSMKSKKPREA